MCSQNSARPVTADILAANGVAASIPSHDVPSKPAQSNGNHGYVVITEHLPVDLPVSEAELAVIETCFGDILDTLFKAASGQGEGAGNRGQTCSGGSCDEHQPTAPGSKNEKTHRRGRVRTR